MKKIAVFFPGIGYRFDRPLLAETRKMMENYDYEIVELDYQLPMIDKGSEEAMLESFRSAFEQTIEMLKDVNWGEYEDIVFISKSVGTCAAAAYEKEILVKNHLTRVAVKQVFFTPVEGTFELMVPNVRCELFHGNADPWAKTDRVVKLAKERNLSVRLFNEANHSLETGIKAQTNKYREIVMQIVKEFCFGA